MSSLVRLRLFALLHNLTLMIQLVLLAMAIAGQAEPVIRHLPIHDRVIALTFDACQTRKPAGYDAKIVRILRETHTPATFMLGGRWIETHPKQTKDLAADALFEIGNHSYLHPHMTRITSAKAKQEIAKTQEILFRLTARKARFFRPPYGEYDAQLVATARDLGLRTLMWDVETGDPDPHESAKAIARTVLRKARPGAIVIMHVNGRGWHSAEALPTIIRELRRRGYRFVRVSDTLD